MVGVAFLVSVKIVTDELALVAVDRRVMLCAWIDCWQADLEVLFEKNHAFAPSKWNTGRAVRQCMSTREFSSYRLTVNLFTLTCVESCWPVWPT